MAQKSAKLLNVLCSRKADSGLWGCSYELAGRYGAGLSGSRRTRVRTHTGEHWAFILNSLRTV